MKKPTLRSSSLHTEASGFVPQDAFGRFRVLHQIGAGTLGPVFRAYEPDRERLVAIKLFRLDLPPDRVHRLIEEFERLVAVGLTHSTVAAPLAAGIHDSAPYLVQEFVSAESLDIVVRDYGPAPPLDTVGLALRLGGALDFAADLGILAGALHPRDVLVSPDEARITGLGVIAALERVAANAPVRRPFTAPERMAGRPWDRRADVYSLAAILHEAFWGRRIAGGAGQVADALTELPGASLDVLRTAFARALADEPAIRFESALEFATAVKGAFRGIDRRDVASERAHPLPLEHPMPLLDDPGQSWAVADDGPRSIGDEPAPEPAFKGPDPLHAGMNLTFDDLERYPQAEPSPVELSPVEPSPVEPSQAEISQETSRAETSRAETPLPMIISTSPLSIRLPAAEPMNKAQSAIWPLALALVVGLAMGFAGGYGVGIRDRAAPTAAPATPAPAPEQTPAAARDYTESAIPVPEPKATVPPAPLGRPPIPPAPAPSELGRILVRSTPAGARVFVDGRDRGRTPAAIRELPDGAHGVRVVQEGYATEERRIVISPSHRVQSVSLALAPTRAPPAAPAGPSFGSLSVDSRPVGASVFVDGRPMGRTPMLVPQIGAGEHIVRLEHDGYRKWSSSIRVVSGERNRVTASLER
jgi:serine/threonine-protein kinase